MNDQGLDQGHESPSLQKGRFTLELSTFTDNNSSSECMAKITLAFRKETVNSVSTNFYRRLMLSTSRSGNLRHLCQNQSGTKKSYCANVCASVCTSMDTGQSHQLLQATTFLNWKVRQLASAARRGPSRSMMQ